MFLCPPMNHSRFYVYAQKKARTKLFLSVFEVFDYLAPNIRVKRVCQNDAPSCYIHKAPTFTSWGFDIS